MAWMSHILSLIVLYDIPVKIRGGQESGSSSRLQPMVLKYYHDSVFGGSLGVNKTFLNIAPFFAWPTLETDVIVIVRPSRDCQLCKPAHKACVGFFFATEVAPYPGHTVHIDISVPLTISKKVNIISYYYFG